jgi:hypothetical protein
MRRNEPRQPIAHLVPTDEVCGSGGLRPGANSFATGASCNPLMNTSVRPGRSRRREGQPAPTKSETIAIPRFQARRFPVLWHPCATICLSSSARRGDKLHSTEITQAAGPGAGCGRSCSASPSRSPTTTFSSLPCPASPIANTRAETAAYPFASRRDVHENWHGSV